MCANHSISVPVAAGRARPGPVMASCAHEQSKVNGMSCLIRVLHADHGPAESPRACHTSRVTPCTVCAGSRLDQSAFRVAGALSRRRSTSMPRWAEAGATPTASTREAAAVLERLDSPRPRRQFSLLLASPAAAAASGNGHAQRPGLARRLVAL